MSTMMSSPTIWDNPTGTDGFEFLEFSAPNTKEAQRLIHSFTALGFVKVAQHRQLALKVYQQGDVRFLVNLEEKGFAHDFSQKHGPCACSMGFRVKSVDIAKKALEKQGVKVFDKNDTVLSLHVPAIEGIGGIFVYLIDDATRVEYEQELTWTTTEKPLGLGVQYLDHVTHNVFRGNMDKWAGFYEKLFNFREIRYFDIEGKLTGLKSRAMTSPCGKIRIPINESSDDKSQIEEYLQAYHGEGIQHIAVGMNDIYNTVTKMRDNQVQFLSVPDNYYDRVDGRVPGHGEDIARLKQLRILIDGAPTQNQGLLLQIFTQNTIGPIFFEMIQRKGNEGFGEGNFKALFESMEQDQIDRGVL